MVLWSHSICYHCQSNLQGTSIKSKWKVKKLAHKSIHVRNSIKAKGYPSAVVSNVLKKKPFSTRRTSLYWCFSEVESSDTYQGFACLFTALSLSERLTSRLLSNNEIQVASKPVKTLQQEFRSPKFRQSLDLQCSLLVNVVYNVTCKGCLWNYVGETGDALKPRKGASTT